MDQCLGQFHLRNLQSCYIGIRKDKTENIFLGDNQWQDLHMQFQKKSVTEKDGPYEESRQTKTY